MDQGTVAEYDYAIKLLCKNIEDMEINQDTIFADMCKSLTP